jgi:hypothetical protein
MPLNYSRRSLIGHATAGGIPVNWYHHPTPMRGDMSLSTRLDKLEAAMRGRDGGDPPDGPRLVYRLCDWAEGCPMAFEEWEKENIPQYKTNALDRLVAAGEIREIDREQVRFIVRRIVQPPERLDGPLPENVVGED